MDKPLKIFGEADPKAVAQIENCLRDESAVAGALMADNHLGYAMPIGGVVAYEDAISPTGVGFDIGCGNKAVRTKINLNDYAPGGLDAIFPGVVNDLWMSDLKRVMREIQKKVEFGVGRKNADPIEHEVLECDIWTEIDKAFGKELYAKARDQLGTVGSGNHYVDLLMDESGYIWVAVHFGSRGLGHTIASGFMAAAVGYNFTDRVPETEESVVLSTKTNLGQFYVEAMQLAGEYAYAGRDYVVDEVLKILDTEATMEVHNHHNYAWFEEGHWIVRKGATPLLQVPAFIGGSMGDISVIVQGKTQKVYYGGSGDGIPMIKEIGHLGSAPHGAGRVMSRTKAAGKFKKVPVERTGPNGEKYTKKIRVRDASTGAVDWPSVQTSLAERGIVVLGAGADEAPEVYKDLRTVLAAHPNIEIVEVLTPLGVVMAGANEFDPYKD